MTTEQPLALKLANELDAYHTRSCHKEAAGELRRLHTENDQLREMYFNSQFEVGEVRSENETLREALKNMLKDGTDYTATRDAARAALALRTGRRSEMTDLNYQKMVEAWKSNDELFKYPFILAAWVGQDDQVEYGLTQDRATVEYVLKVMAKNGYRCSIVEQLLGELK